MAESSNQPESFIRIEVEQPTPGSILHLYIAHATNIIDLVKLIEEKTGLPYTEFDLVYNEKRLSDCSSTLQDYGVKDGSKIKMVLKLRGGFQCYFRILGGRTVPIECSENDTIWDLKERLSENIKDRPAEMKFIYQGQILDDCETVQSSGITHLSVINVQMRLRGGMQIYAKTMDGKTVTLEISKGDLIIDIKKKLQDKIGIFPEEMKLVFQGGILKDYKTAEEYQISERTVINVITRLGPKIVINSFVKGEKKSIDIIYHGRNVMEFKEIINERIDVEVEDQILLYQGKVMENDINLDNYGIKEGDVIELKVNNE